MFLIINQNILRDISQLKQTAAIIKACAKDWSVMIADYSLKELLPTLDLRRRRNT